jgi:Cu/Ag efflux protein CusF
MKRIILFLVAAAVVLSLPATAAAFRGVAVAKEPARHAVVVASGNGAVRTVRAPGRAGSMHLGRQLVYSAKRLSDGTFRATSLRVRGRAAGALVRGVVVRNQAKLHRLLISAGGSVFAVRSSARHFSSTRSGARPGDRVEVRVRIAGNGLVARTVTIVGHDNGLELEGIFLGTTPDGNLRLAVVHRGEVFVAVPQGFSLPQLSPGDEIELVVTVDTAGAFTLVSIQVDDENDDDNEGIDEDHGKVEVKGAITDLSANSITVQSNHASPVTCFVPDGVDLSAFKVGDQVEMKCALVGDKLTLTRLKREDNNDDDGDNGDNDDGGDGHGGDH